MPRRYLFYVEQNYCYGILRPIQNVLRSRGDEVAWLPVGDAFDRGGFEAGERVFDHVREAIAWSPCAVMVPGNFVPGFIPGIKVMVTHGLISEKRRKKDGVIYSFIERGLFDLYITHGPNTTTRWRQMADEAGYFEVAECGWPKLDPLFDGSLRRNASAGPVIYFASTFSPRLAAAPRLFDTVARLVAERDWQWRIQFHPKMPAAVTDRYRALSGDRLRVVDGHDTLQLLLDADVMLCDTSSIISEFALLQKPVVTYRNLSPRPYMIDVREPSAVGPALARALQRPPEVMRAVAEHARETHPWTDGRSSERVIEATDRLVESGLGHLRPKPRNRIRHWKMRRALRYYRLFPTR
ncbi:UDP-N-acetylglucosamine 2-epimerase [Elongatibacter sediminis]|uniref:UDP-N-acetylglucosamine 2-epimerase n=1 Tax=Elongatibacter sediminis TaxID=3119006 RepID=A0AAW9RNA7_9GAMM